MLFTEVDLSLIFGFRLHVYIHDFNINLVLDNAFLLIERQVWDELFEYTRQQFCVYCRIYITALIVINREMDLFSVIEISILIHFEY